VSLFLFKLEIQLFPTNWYQSEMNSENTSLGQMPLPKLNKSNYDNWSVQIRALFDAQDVWESVTSGYVEPTQAQIAVMSVNQTDVEGEASMYICIYI
jgi:Domain of unknown function (DUF4219)